MALLTQTAHLQKKVHQTIKNIWINHISNDYNNFFLLKEDTFKNAFYYHLRQQLTDEFLQKNHLRIYTEFHYKGFIADLAIVQLNENPGQQRHLQDDIEAVLAVIELKYKNGLSDIAFQHDIIKMEKYIGESSDEMPQYYLAFIHEVIYEGGMEESWLTEQQKSWARGRLTELNAFFIEGSDAAVWRVFSHNDWDNEDLDVLNQD